MNTDAISVARAFVAAVNRRSLAEIGALLSDDHTFIDSRGGTRLGREAMGASWQAYLALFPDYEISVDRMLADKGLVAIFGQASGTYRGKRGLVPENRIAMPAAWQVRVRNGRITHWQVYADWSEGTKIIERENRHG